MRLRWALGGVVAGSLLLTACNGLDVPKAAKTPTPLPPLPTVSHPSPQVPEDRDLARLVAALTQVDSCALLDAAKAQAPGFTGADKFRRTSAHTCRIANAHGEWVRIELAVGSSRMTRFDLETDSIGGAKVYRERPSGDSCVIEVPIAFDYSISIYSHLVGASPAARCRPVDAFAKIAVPALAKAAAPAKVPAKDPAKISAKASTPAGTPLAGWSGCALLGAIRGRPIGTFGIGAYPTNDVDGCTEKNQGELVAFLSLSYGEELDPSMFERITPIGGDPTGVDSPGESCRLTWIAGPSGQTDPAYKFVRLIAAEKTCALAAQLAAKMKATLAGPIPKPAPALFPIYLRPGEPDSDQPGACADVDSFVVASNAEFRCRPYVPVDAPPKGAAEVLRAVQADGNVVCAISLEAVRQRLGADLRPVTIGGRGCRYVEPSHGLEVTVAISEHGIARNRKARTVKIGKHSGWTEAVALSQERYNVHINVDRPGVSLRVSFEFKPPRGTDRPATEREKELIPIGAAIVDEYF